MSQSTPFEIVGLRFPSFYIKEFAAAVAFYSSVFGPPEAGDPRIKGWKLGDTWLTLFPSEDAGIDPESNPKNAEFAVQVRTPQEVDRLFDCLVEAGAKGSWKPKDTEMYIPMRFGCVDDPFGIRIDVFCPIES